jgi:crossover junction endodeoxyribonuclease RuvC
MILGIDPGKHGAIAFITSKTGQLAAVFDMPTLEIKVGKTMRERVSAHALVEFFNDKLKDQVIEMVVVEKVGGMSGDGGSVAFTFGYGCGLLEGVIVGRGLPITLITPQAWKKAAGLQKDKSLARQRAMQLWPNKAKDFARVMDDGRAEAALIGWHYWNAIPRS